VRCTRGRAAATDARRPSSCISTRARAAGCGQLPAPAPCRLGDRLQRVAVQRSDRRPGVPAHQGRGDAVADRPLLGGHRHLRPRIRSLPHPRCGRSRRIPRRLSRRRRAGPGRQRLHQRHRRMGPQPRPGPRGAPARSLATGGSSPASNGPRHGLTAARPWKRTSPTSRAARPAKASTSAPWQAPSTWCSVA
jgi:hypothetical protein